jgi:hypothetical protein
MPTIHPDGFRFNGKVYKTVEEFRAAMLEAARARPEIHPEGRPVEAQPEDTPNLDHLGPFEGRRSREGFEWPP